LWMAQRSREEMEGLRRSSRRALVSWWDWYAEVAEGAEDAKGGLRKAGEEGRPPPFRQRRTGGDTSPGSPGEERLNAALKSYSANWFDVCMWELSQTAWTAQVRGGVVRGCCARRG